jgi:hypothetical protein
MKTRVIHTRFWKDSYVRRLTPGEKLVFNYLLTNEKVNIIHCYEIDLDEIVFDVGLSKGTVKDAMQRLQQDKKIAYYNGWCFLGNASKYEKYTGEKNVTAKETLLKEMSNKVLDWYNNLIDRGMIGVYIPPINHKPEIINKSFGKSRKPFVKPEETLDIISEEVMSGIVERYQVPIAFVRSKYDDLCNWVNEDPTRARGRDLRSTLASWVKKDAVALRKEENGKSKLRIITPDTSWKDSA